MQAERNALIQTFELLKIEAAKRDVSLSVVDLRWGITDEEAKSGKVISVCLNEIENSHPFFIGILGSNYGTAPDRTELKKNPELIERYPWLDDAISDNKDESMSITEMEIQYGVLNNDNIDTVFFFKLCNQPDNHKRLTTLKETIRKKYDPSYQNNFTTSSELCEKVIIKVRKIINKHFPERNIVTPLDRERIAQRAYINSRHSYYFKRQSYFDIIDSFAESLQRINEAEKIARYLLGYNKLSGATLAITLENKGLKLKEISNADITEIESCYKEALNLYSQLAKLFPNKYTGDMADMYEKIAMLISDDSLREIEVFDMFEKSLRQYEQCLIYSDDYFIDIARIHNNIGWTYYKTAKNYTDLMEAKKHLMKCLSIRRNLVQTGELQEGALYKVLCNLYTVFQQLGMCVEAMHYYIEATQLKMKLNGYGRR